MKNSMESSQILILEIEEGDGQTYVHGLNLENGKLLPKLSCASKKPLQVGAINYMYAYNNKLRFTQTSQLQGTETPTQRIENILDGFDLVKNKYEKEYENLYDKQVYGYAVIFKKMATAMQQIAEKEVKQKSKDAFLIWLDNIDVDFEKFREQLYHISECDDVKKGQVIRENTNNIKDDMHKLNLVWDLRIGSNLEIWDKLADEGVSSSELLNVQSKREPKEVNTKVEQKTLLDF